MKLGKRNQWNLGYDPIPDVVEMPPSWKSALCAELAKPNGNLLTSILIGLLSGIYKYYKPKY